MAEEIVQDETPTETTAVANPTNWQDRLAKFAVAAVAAEAAPSGSFISAKSGVLQFAGAAVAGNALDIIVIDSIYENTYYTGDYDPDNTVSPVCFAFAHNDDELAPPLNVFMNNSSESSGFDREFEKLDLILFC